MPDYRLSKTERNQLALAATEIGLDPASFEWKEESSKVVGLIHVLTHPSTRSFMRVGYSLGQYDHGYELDYWPRRGELDAPGDEFQTLFPEIRTWLEWVKEESDAPDLWAIARESRAWLGSSGAEGGNDSFTQNQVDQIVQHLQTIEAFTVKNYHLNAAHQAFVHGRMEYLAEAAARVGRLDWKNIFASTLLNIIVTIGLDPVKAQGLYGLATQLLGPLVAGAARLLGSGG